MTTETIIINEYPLMVRDYNTQRVVTFKDIDKLHKRPLGTAKRNFTTNKEYFIENEDYFEISRKDVGTNFVPTYGFAKQASRGIILTETGYLMLVKSFTDDLAWQIQRELVNTYFKVKHEIATPVQLPLEIVNLLTNLSNKLNCIDEIQSKVNRLESLIITMLPPPKRSLWKFEMGNQIRQMAEKLNIEAKFIYSDIYFMMQNDYEANINEAKQQYLLNNPTLNTASTIDVVDSESNLKELFETIVDNYLDIQNKVQIN